MDKLKMQTSNKANENFEKLAKMFPNAVTESIDENGEVVRAIDKDVLMQEISCKVVEGREERYQFTWPDKKQSVLTANAPIHKTLRPCRAESVDFDKTENLYIEGDNLEVLKLLQETYLGKIKMIYIDPPYNTGNDFVYNDDFAQSTDDYISNSGQLDEEGNRLVQNNESNGRFHTDWLNMIYPRLKLAKDLLSDDGVIFISIDDNEVENLKKCCDEIFGEDNYVNTITLKTKASAGASGGGEDKRLKKNVEYVLWYAKSLNSLTYQQPLNKIKLMDYIAEHKKNGVGFYYTRVITDYGQKEYLGSIQDGAGDEIKIYKHQNFEFSSVSELSKKLGKSMEEIYNEYSNHIFMVTNAQTSLLSRVNNYVNEKNSLISYEYVPKTGKSKGKLESKLIWNKTLVVWLKDTMIEEDGVLYKTEIKGTLWDSISWGRLDLEGNIVFKNGKKPIALMRSLMEMITSNDDCVLDFFSGSASTAHAVMQLNAEDGGNRKFIMVQLPEQTDEKSEAYKAGYKNICEIGKERIRRAGKKIKEENGLNAQNLDVGFRVLKCDSSNMKDVYYAPDDYRQDLFDSLTDNIKEDRTPEDLLFQVMLDLGVLLSSKIEVQEICGKRVFNVADGYLYACLDENVSDEVVKAIAEKEPYYAVFRDKGMASDSVMTNFDQIFASISPKTVRKVI